MMRQTTIIAAIFILTSLLVWFLFGELFYKPLLDVTSVIEVCNKSSNSPKERKDLVAFYNMKSEYRVAPQYHLATCHIQKLGSTILAAVLCYLYDTANFVNANRTIETDEWNNRFCQGRNEISGLANLTKRMGPDDYTVIALVRDPMERFISGFVDKCVNEQQDCLGCYQEPRCFVDRLYDGLSYFPENNKTMEPHYIYAHFAPQTWYCSGNLMMDKLKYIKYANHGTGLLKMIMELTSVMREQKVEKYKIEHIISVMNSTQSSHTTHGSQVSKIMKQIIMEDEYVQMMVKKIFHYDFKLYDIVSIS